MVLIWILQSKENIMEQIEFKYPLVKLPLVPLTIYLINEELKSQKLFTAFRSLALMTVTFSRTLIPSF